MLAGCSMTGAAMVFDHGLSSHVALGVISRRKDLTLEILLLRLISI